jgi:hypothetical protein
MQSSIVISFFMSYFFGFYVGKNRTVAAKKLNKEFEMFEVT